MMFKTNIRGKKKMDSLINRWQNTVDAHNKKLQKLRESSREARTVDMPRPAPARQPEKESSSDSGDDL